MGNPSPEAWSRVRRYASWMRRVRVDEWLSPLEEDTLRHLRLNSPTTGRWFPALRDLSWCITKYNPPYADLFLSPHLERVSIYTSWTQRESAIPLDILPTIASTIAALSVSTLRRLLVGMDSYGMSWEYFKDTLSSVILRCGPSLTELTSPIPLSDAAVNHVLQLPHLHIWHIEGPPPNHSTSSLPLVFPPLTELTLGEDPDAGCGWLSLFRRLEDRDSTSRGVTPLSRMKKTLDSLEIQNLSSPMTDASLTSTIQIFRNLTRLIVGNYCHDGDGEGQCISKLNDTNVAELAMSLSQLEHLHLGHPCFENTCATTVACLLLISVHCVKLQSLEIHFNTTNIIDDLKNISEDPRFQELRSLPKCTLSRLDVYLLPLALDGPGIEIVASRMIDILPHLKHCEGLNYGWDELSETLKHVSIPAHRG